ncbi:DNA-3-methyladenine glycosylase [Kiloniella laminariae]|uniref:DNA-3-methyladenine glycosylase II n=1 Tax=Kiloniella laminariae TaxID=454162 RepID=A0ABT4LKL8_9PROT|nr:DNA-3-methyladenine glycosylase [Kiloniella laminariae]MCZ4281663.1 DNA-3-methyladenine glycosylase [Kiloniella laminariae]
MSDRKIPDENLRPALEALSSLDPDIARAFAEHGLPPERSQEAGFDGLIRMIISQQVSVQSARAILGRLLEQVGVITPQEILKLDDEGMKAAGLSRPKQRYARGLAEDVLSGKLQLDLLPGMDDEAVIDHLIAVKGIGRWTCEIYLLFALRRPDVMPAADLALQEAMKHLKGLRQRPGPAEMYQLSELWRPYRSAGARFLWHYYRHAGIA